MRTGASWNARVFRLSAESPSLFLRFKSLGPSKLYQIAKLPRAKRAAALRARHEGKSVPEMSDAQLHIALAAFRPPAGRKVTPRMRAHGLRMRIRAMRSDLRAARRTLGPLPPDALSLLSIDLTALATESTSLRREISRTKP